jgi:hypothetical protein
MRSFRNKTLGVAVGGALVAASLTPAPALARGFGDDIEEILIGAAVLAGVIAVATDVLKDEVDDWDRDRRRTRGSDDRSLAVDDCTRTAEREAERYGRYARVRDVDVDRDGSEYRVKGEVEIERESSWDRERRNYDRAKFTCTARYGRVTAFRFTDGFGYASRFWPASP